MQGRKRIKIAGVANREWPCYAVGHTDEYLDDEGNVHTLQGTGRGHAECHAFIEANLFDKGTCPAPTVTTTASCSFDGQYQPSLSATFADNDIYAFSYFFDKFAEPFGLATSSNGFSVGELRAAAEKVCSGTMSSSELSKLGEEAAKLFEDVEWCTDLGFMYGLLSIGYEIPDDRVLKTAKKINGVETGWSLGAALNMVDSWGKKGKGVCVKEVN